MIFDIFLTNRKILPLASRKQKKIFSNNLSVHLCQIGFCATAKAFRAVAALLSMGGIYQNGFVCYNPLNNSQIHKLTKTLSHPSFTYNHMDDTSHCGQKVVENVNFLAHIPVTQYSFANLLHFRRRRWAFKEGVRYSSNGSLGLPEN